MIEHGYAQIISTISQSEERKRVMGFSNGFRKTSKYAVYTLSGNTEKIDRIKDLELQKVGFIGTYDYYPEFDANKIVKADYKHTISNPMDTLYGISAIGGNEALLNVLNEGLSRISSDGTLENIEKKYM